MSNSIKGFRFNGNTYKYDYTALDNAPNVETDKTLAITDRPADAKVVGDEIASIRNAVGTPLTAETASGMTDRNKIYVYTGSETGYTNGNWYYFDTAQNKWVSGGAYNSAAIDTDDTLTYAGKAADAKAVGDEVTNLKSALNDVPEKINNALTGIRTYTQKEDEIVIGSYIPTANSGSTVDLTNILDGRGSTRTISYALFDVFAGDTIYLTGRSLIGGSTRAISLVDDNGLVLKTVGSEDVYKTWKMVADVNCKCLITVVTWSINLGDVKTDIVVISDDNFTEIAQNVKQINKTLSPLETTDGWYSLPVEDFALNDWTGWSGGTTSRTNRVRYNKILSFQRRVFILAAPGFYLNGYYADGSFETQKCVELPANKQVRIYIRRITEISETADINEFASSMLISSGFAGMEKYEHTYTDVTMFPRIGISGDSYSAGGGVISGIRSLTWGKNIERESGVIVDIYAQSGISIQQWTTNSENGLPALLAGEECGLYWFAHGINGTGSDASIGTPEDMSAEPKPNTFYGQYVYAIEAIQRVFPQARIVIATITGTSYSLYETKYKKVNNALRNIAEYCSVPLIDLADDDFYKSNWYANHHLSNHPTVMLNAGIAHANRRLLAKCIMENDSYFIDYGDKYVFPVSCQLSNSGKITATPSIAASGTTITLSNVAYSGHSFVRYESDDVEITGDTFVMPNKKVTITGVFEAD